MKHPVLFIMLCLALVLSGCGDDPWGATTRTQIQANALQNVAQTEAQAQQSQAFAIQAAAQTEALAMQAAAQMQADAQVRAAEADAAARARAAEADAEARTRAAEAEAAAQVEAARAEADAAKHAADQATSRAQIWSASIPVFLLLIGLGLVAAIVVWWRGRIHHTQVLAHAGVLGAAPAPPRPALPPADVQRQAYLARLAQQGHLTQQQDGSVIFVHPESGRTLRLMAPKTQTISQGETL